MRSYRLPWEKRIYIVAEAGVNHNGNVETARRLIDQAVRIKADAIKFQTWKMHEIIGKYSHKVAYIKKTARSEESLPTILNRLCLPFRAFRELKKYAEKQGIQFLSTPDGLESLHFLADELSVPIIKIGSTEITNIPYLGHIASKHRPMILSTGLSSLGEVEHAITAIRRITKAPLVLLHCTSEYPAPNDEMNIKAMVTMKDAFHLPVGLSDHSLGGEAAIAAAALGAVVIEKHLTLDKSMPGPDHRASMNPDEMRELILSIRKTEQLLGDGLKRITPSEQRNIDGIRRSVVALRFLGKGTLLTNTMLGCKRPGTGLSPEFQKIIIGMRLTSNVAEDEPIQWRHFKE